MRYTKDISNPKDGWFSLSILLVVDTAGACTC
jgi:hypothetical protein